ncbi:discoidin domain-containing protein [Pendulispora rubella]|uniref:Discoidin domain-containing protein n=1 Tax=Pendulispora rubella TaxID=2741070 RepID=A0ABZ2LNN0_9BACT
MFFGFCRRIGGASLLCAAACVGGDASEGGREPPALSALSVPGRGARVSFIEQEAEDAVTNGTALAKDRTRGTLAAEASGRRAVTLSGQGQYVEFTLTEPANAIAVRYSLPDSSDGSGIDATLSLYADGTKLRDLALTSRYSWYYGAFPYTNHPNEGNAHHFYEEARALLPSTLPPGTKVRLQIGPGNNAPSYTIDLADFELVPTPAAMPANALSVTDFGATPNDTADDSDAFDAAIASARNQGKEVWVPQGTFLVGRHVTVDRITIRGAGHWYTELRGARVGLYGKGEPDSCGTGGTSGASSNVKLYDFAIIGQVDRRLDCDQVNGIGGAMGGGSEIAGLWIQHTKVGIWLDGPFDGLSVRNNRIYDQTADGLNLHRGISHVTVSDNFVRNTGDDGLAMWSEPLANHDNTFSHNTVVAPILANGIGIYGGYDNNATDNVLAESQDAGGAIYVANRFSAVPLSGTTTLARNTALRTGVLDSNLHFGIGALWFDGRDSEMSGTIDVSDTDLIDNSYEAIQFLDKRVTNVHFRNVRIDGAGTFAVQVQAPGSASFSNVVATGVGHAGVYDCQGAGAFSIADGGGNSGWSSTYCGAWPTPVYHDGPVNLARGKPVEASSAVAGFPPSNANDGDFGTYWESTNNAFPQTLTVDLGAPESVSRIVLGLPSTWTSRTQTLSALVSTDGTSFAPILGARGVVFDPASGNTATLTFPATSSRYLRLEFTANTGWPAGQLSELEAYAR